MKKISPLEKHLFLEGIAMKYGYNFQQYSEASMYRRLERLVEKNKSKNLLSLLSEALDSKEVFSQILPQLTINTTEFFRDPLFFRSLRHSVVPVLKTFPSVVIWIAGCSTGEEVLSLSIMLKEENIFNKCTIYATDINPQVLKTAKAGIYDSSAMSVFNKNYALAGGRMSPSDYYTADYGLVRFDSKLLSNVVFSEYNLVTDAPFIEANLILCRNVLIYFNRDLQNRVIDLFIKSLNRSGFLGVGTKESVKFTNYKDIFLEVEPQVYSFKSRNTLKQGADNGAS